MTAHDLKTWPTYFQRVWDGDKTFEVRLDDRGYQAGDTVTLREWDRKSTCSCPVAETRGDHADDCARYSGRIITARIGFVMASTPGRGNQRGFVGNGYVVFSLVDPTLHDGRPRYSAGPDVKKGDATAVVIVQHTAPVSAGAAAHAIAAAAARRQQARQ